MKIKKSLLKEGNLLEDIIKLKAERLRKKAEERKLSIEAKAAKEKDRVEKDLAKAVESLNTSLRSKQKKEEKKQEVKNEADNQPAPADEEEKKEPVKKSAPKTAKSQPQNSQTEGENI